MKEQLVYHITFDDDLPGTLHPRQPHGSEFGINKYSETLPDRVSFSPTLEKCWFGIYANISKYFEDEKYQYPYLTMYVYGATILEGTQVVSKEDMKENLPDYHMTDEVCVTEPIDVFLIAKIEVKNNVGEKDPIMFHPYNDKKLEEIVAGQPFEYRVIAKYNNTPLGKVVLLDTGEGDVPITDPKSLPKHDPEFIEKNIKIKGGVIYTEKRASIEFPKWYVDKKLADFGEDTTFFGICCIVIEGKYSLVTIPTMLRSNPINLDEVNRDNMDFIVLEFGPGDPIIKTTSVIQETLLSYDFYNNFLLRSKVPWFIQYEDLNKIMNNLPYYAGSRVGDSPITNETTVAFVARDPDDPYTFYRQSKKKKKPIFMDMMNVHYSVRNTVDRFTGGYFDDATVAVIMSDPKEPTDIEKHLKG